MTSMQEAWQLFTQGVASVLRQWTVVNLAVDNEWGGVESKRKRQLLEDQLIQMFRTRKELYRDQVEDFLTEFLEDEFSTYADDGSPAEVATLLTDMFKQCGQMNFTLVRTVLDREPVAVSNHKLSAAEATGDSDSDSSDEDDEDVMDTEGKEGSAKAKPPKEVRGPDADGWESVPTRRRK